MSTSCATEMSKRSDETSRERKSRSSYDKRRFGSQERDGRSHGGRMSTVAQVPERIKTRESAATVRPLSERELDRMNAFWRACNYLSVGMIYLKENPLLREPLSPEHVKQ